MYVPQASIMFMRCYLLVFFFCNIWSGGHGFFFYLICLFISSRDGTFRCCCVVVVVTAGRRVIEYYYKYYFAIGLMFFFYRVRGGDANKTPFLLLTYSYCYHKRLINCIKFILLFFYIGIWLLYTVDLYLLYNTNK